MQQVGRIASVDVLFPSLFVNYTIEISKGIKPYLGAGLNYTIFSGESPTNALQTTLGGATDVKLKNSFGVAAQAGIRFELSERWYLNANYIWIDVDSDATTRTAGVVRSVELGLDPSIMYLSVGYTF